MENVLVSVDVIKLSFDNYKYLQERGLLEDLTMVSSGPFSASSIYRYTGTEDDFDGLYYNNLLIFA